jgi:hypothetical protein
MKDALQKMSHLSWRDGITSGNIPTLVDNISILGRHPLEAEKKEFVLDPRAAEESPMWNDERREKMEICSHFWDDRFDQILVSSIERDGVFWAKPFWNTIKVDVRKLVKKNPLGEDVFDPENQWLGQEWQGRRKRLSPSTIWSEIGWLFQLYACKRASELTEAVIAYSRQLSEQALYHRCLICGWVFRPCDLPDYLYLGKEGSVDFCHTCLMCMFSMDQQGHRVKRFSARKSDMRKALYELVELVGFVPPQDFRGINTLRRVPRERRSKVILHLWKMQSAERYKEKFGSWLEALIAAEVLSNNCYPTGKGTRCLARDGHECRSLEERQIDDWLYDAGIPHAIEPAYPYHPKLNPNERSRADWEVNGVFIEYWGLVGDKDYDRRMRVKRKLAKENGILLLEIYPDDLYDLSSKLGHLKRVTLQK